MAASRPNFPRRSAANQPKFAFHPRQFPVDPRQWGHKYEFDSSQEGTSTFAPFVGGVGRWRCECAAGESMGIVWLGRGGLTGVPLAFGGLGPIEACRVAPPNHGVFIDDRTQGLVARQGLGDRRGALCE